MTRVVDASPQRPHTALPPLPQWVLSLTLLLLVILPRITSAVHNHPRSNVLPRDYASRDYYVIEIPGEDSLDAVTAFGENTGLRFEERIGSLQDLYLFSAPKTKKNSADDEDLTLLRRELSKRSLSGRNYLEKLHTKKLVKRLPVSAADSWDDKASLVASAVNIQDPEFKLQWHLLNREQSGHDLNVSAVWLQNIIGKDVVTAIVDDGLDFESDDLKDSFFAKGSYDFNDASPLPKPVLADDRHGTRCAGEIAATKNEVCGVGVAYGSKVSGIRILSKEISDADEAIALNYAMEDNDIYSCSWGPADDGQEVGGPGPLIQKAFINGVQNGRSGKGSVFVFASGNGAGNGDNCNYDGYTNSIFTITVGAIDREDNHPYYSEDCAALLVVTYSSGAGAHIHTTDVGKRKCTAEHGGTSAAAPLAAGVLALVLSVRPDLTWRDVQYLLIDTALPIRNDDAILQTTALGKEYSHRYGYGKIDAYAIVERAKTWELVKPQTWYDSPAVVLNQKIPQGSQTGVTSFIDVDASALAAANLARAEHVQIKVTIYHQRRGQVSVKLLSPTGVVSLLAPGRVLDMSKEGFTDWTFTSVAHWGDAGIGRWTLTVQDETADAHSGVVVQWQMRMWGEAQDASKAVKYSFEDLEQHAGSPAPASGNHDTPDAPDDGKVDQQKANPFKVWWDLLGIGAGVNN
ncbi:peptidase S8/S53 domain-containing protein [Limtongia smithiae]|uniref:peptidase S8/S53 domain-containing protein n=1 Tax=Limtongia smithiae TaxID=1125753 RepID=UPI0034CE8AC0